MKKLFVYTIAVTCLLFCTQFVFAQGHQLKMANKLYEQFDYQRAIEVYKGILKKDKKNAEASEKLAHCYRLTSNTRRAESAYKKAIRYNKNKNILKFYYAQALMSNKKYEDALDMFKTYTDLSPKDSRGWRFLESCENISEYLKDSSMYKISKMAINSSQSDFSPTFYKDGLVFTSARTNAGTNRKSRSKWTGEAYTSMYFTSPQSGNNWSKAVSLEGKQTNPYHEGPAVFNKKGNVMFFTRNVSKGKKSSFVNLRLFETRLLRGEWQDERELPFNSDSYSVGHPALSADGYTIYFASDMPGGYGGKDIYESTLVNGLWTRPRNLGKNVNTEGDEMFPFMHDDGSLYYASDGLGGFGGLDIFSAQRTGNSWTVTNVGYPINSAKDDFGLILTPDKQTGYLASNRKGSRGDDIYMLYIKEEKAAEMVAVVPPKPKMQQRASAGAVESRNFREKISAGNKPKPTKKPMVAKVATKPPKKRMSKPIPTEELPNYDNIPFEAADRASSEPNKMVEKAEVPSVIPTKKFEAADRPSKEVVTAKVPVTPTKKLVTPPVEKVIETATRPAEKYDIVRRTEVVTEMAPPKAVATPKAKAVVAATKTTTASKSLVKTAVSPAAPTYKMVPLDKYEKKIIAIEETEVVETAEHATENKPSSFRTTTVIHSVPKEFREPGVYDMNPTPNASTPNEAIVGANPAPAPAIGGNSSSYNSGGGFNKGTKKGKKDIRLVLIGIVLDKTSKRPIGGAHVELIDLMTQRKQEFTTETDGNFYFKLEPERNYRLLKITDGQTEDQKVISTVNKLSTEILHAILEGGEISGVSNTIGSGYDDNYKYSTDSPDVLVWSVDESKDTKGLGVRSDAYADPYDDSHLTFKIQIGAFKRSMQPNGFFSKVEGKVEVERAANGFNRYVTGNFRNYKEAETYQKELFRKGYNKSFVAAYLNGYRLEMPVEEVLEMYYNHR